MFMVHTSFNKIIKQEVIGSLVSGKARTEDLVNTVEDEGVLTLLGPGSKECCIGVINNFFY